MAQPFANGPASRPAYSWQLIWVYEHIGKPKHQEETTEIAKHAGYFNGKLTCVKQAARVETIVSQRKRCMPWILMTDFRGFTPCMNFLANVNVDGLMMVIVHCQQDKQVTKAARSIARCNNSLLLQNCVHVTLASPLKSLQELTEQWCGLPWFPKDETHDSDTQTSYGKMSDNGTDLISEQQWKDLVPARIETSLNDDPFIKGLSLATPPSEVLSL